MATLVEQQVATETEGGSLPGGNSLMSESPLSKATRLQTPECLSFLLCLYMFAATIFLWYLAWYEWMCGDPHCLQCSVFVT